MSNIRKIGVLVGITGLVLAMASGTGFALTVNFDECPGGVCTDGAPTITLSNGGNVVILQTDAALPEPTASVVKATLSGTSADVIPVGQYFVTLMERPGVASDVITLTAGIQTSGTCGTTANSCIQLIEVDFSSDTDPSTLPVLGTQVLENGNQQNLTSSFKDTSGTSVITNANYLSIGARSDAPESVPEPASLLLLGSGLAGLALWRRRHA